RLRRREPGAPFLLGRVRCREAGHADRHRHESRVDQSARLVLYQREGRGDRGSDELGRGDGASARPAAPRLAARHAEDRRGGDRRGLSRAQRLEAGERTASDVDGDGHPARRDARRELEPRQRLARSPAGSADRRLGESRMRRGFLAVGVVMLGLAAADSSFAQRRPRNPNLPPPEPTPRTEDGRVLLGGATVEQKGVWTPLFGITDPIAPADEVPFKPWAKALYDARQAHELEPHARCKASGTARQFLTPYGVEFVELP